MFVNIVIGRKTVQVLEGGATKGKSVKPYNYLWHPEVEFFIINYDKLSMTILRKEAISQEVMQFLQGRKLSVADLRYIARSNSRKSKPVHPKQLELF